MVASKTYKGIEYIQLSSLPKEQYDVFLKTVTEEIIIKIKVKEEILPDCIQYKDYVSWYRNVFTTPGEHEKTILPQNQQPRLVVQKA